MSSQPASLRGHGRKSLPGFVLFGSLLAAGIIVGLLLMHGLNVHSMPATPQYTAASVLPSTNSAVDSPAASSHDALATPADGCANCDSHSQHLAAGAACFLGLLASLLLLRRPAGKILRGEWFSCPEPVFSPVLKNFVRTPSLHELCISRT